MTYMNNPCTPDCPNRNAECHATCERYLAFDEARRKLSKWKEIECTINHPSRTKAQKIRTKLLNRRK